MSGLEFVKTHHCALGDTIFNQKTTFIAYQQTKSHIIFGQIFEFSATVGCKTHQDF